MSNKIYSDTFFNESLKLRYLDTLNEGSKPVAERVLKRAAYLEENSNKDLYNFSLSECEKLIKALGARTLGSARSSFMVVRYYIRWAINEGLRDNNLNPLDTVAGEDYYLTLVDSSGSILFTKSRIDITVADLVNAQDSGIVQCLFEGIMGTGYSEILNLKKIDLIGTEESTTLSLIDDKAGQRELKVSQKLIDLLRDASREDIYQYKNGEASENAKYSEIDLANNEYIFRPGGTNIKDKDMKASSHLVLRRLKTTEEVLDYNNFTAINIRKSGMLSILKTMLFNTDGKLIKNKMSNDDEELVMKQFNIKPASFYNYKREFLNLDTVRKIYQL